MEILEMDQGTPEWYAARAGRPSASGADKIITPSGKITSKAKREDYQYDLIASWLSFGRSDMDSFTSSAMQRGKDLEPVARKEYQFMTGHMVEEVGFCIEGAIGCSPDGLILHPVGSEVEGWQGMLEIKCPYPKTHTKYTIMNVVPTEYIPQLQWQMMVCNQPWVDFMSFSPYHEPFIIRCDRDEEYLGKLDEYLFDFLKEMETIKRRLKRRGIEPIEGIQPE